MMKSLRRKSSISASRVAVRPQTPAYIRWVAVAVLTLLALGLSWGMYDAGRKFAGFDKNEITYELDRLSQLNAGLQTDNDELRIRVAGLDRQLQMDLVAREDITKQVKTLEHENTRLKEDLAFFQSLGSTPGKSEQRISLGRLKLERGNFPGEYRYSLLLVQGKQRPGDFHGGLEFTINVEQNGEKMEVPLADGASTEVSFKFYQRVENVFRMPPDTVVESMQVKLFEKGVAQARLIQTVNLSL